MISGIERLFCVHQLGCHLNRGKCLILYDEYASPLALRLRYAGALL